MVWSAQWDRDPAAIWLREQVAATLAGYGDMPTRSAASDSGR
ncbi:hypothetical protein [Acidiphilium iwatense]|nr:hypothetical protein [Acidiphilium iwatense]